MKRTNSIFAIILSATLAMIMPIYSSNAAATETTGQYVKDSAITTDIKTKLFADTDLKSLHITVKTKKGVVTLSGKVPTADQKTKAATVATGSAGVKEVINHLKVKAD